MACEQIREALSARLDGEELPGEAATTDAHLETCAACRQWLDRAAAINRLARISLAASPGDVDDLVPQALRRLAAASGRPRTRAWVVAGLRVLLGVLGAVQALLAVAQIAVPSMTGMTMTGTADGATPNHFLHEAAAWNLAVGTAFMFIAVRRTRPAAVLPLLTAFVATLSLLSIDDLLAGAVAYGRLASHALLLLGYALVVALSLPRLRPDDPPTGSRTRTARRRGGPTDATVISLRPRRLHGQPTARTRHRAA